MLTTFLLVVAITIVSCDIIGPDSRVPVTDTSGLPYSAIGLVSTNRGTCTGTMVGRRTMLTAFHCLHFNDEGILQPLWFTTGVNQTQNEENLVYASNAYWINKTMETSFDGLVTDNITAYDFALVNLSKSVGDVSGWMTLGEFAGEYDNPWNVTGYEQNTRLQLHETVLITGFTSYNWSRTKAYNIRTNADFVIGQSGSPLYKLSNGVYTIMAVMSTMQGTHSEAAGGPALLALSSNLLDI